MSADEPEQFAGMPSISCHTCLQEVPHSEAAGAEAQDYVLFFCGLECYRHWERAAKLRGVHRRT